ncbi:MAG: M28 family metallopeptidase [Chloroflexi bacterium]|nr:M28 family metallopeptidase [Chloroflexota bacterium]
MVRTLLARLARRPAGALAAALVVAGTACSGGAEPQAAPVTPAPAATEQARPTPAAAAEQSRPTAAPEHADAARAFAHVRMLAGSIGPRVAGSPEEERAADYVAVQLSDAGYEVSIEPFPVPPPPGSAELSAPALDGPLAATFMTGAPRSAVEGPVVLVPGRGSADDFSSVEVQGAVAVVRRGVLTFAEKARHAERAGAAALLVVNSEPGELWGTLGQARPALPVLGVSRETGEAIEALRTASPGALLAIAPGGETVESQNVVGRPGGAACTAYLGAHYDSVPASPGANDNASGVALLIELARLLRGEPGSGTLCVVAFGAEEVGLVGSQAFVAAHDVADADFMLNFDMVSKMTTPIFVGDAELAGYAAGVARDLGEQLEAGDFPPFASSDHASFEAAGVSAITVHSGEDPFIHRPEDGIANSSADDLGRMLRVSAELARRLLASGGIPRE